MRDIITTTTARMVPPTPDQRAAAASGGDLARHDGFVRDWPCMTQLEIGAPPSVLPMPQDITVAAWNIERCKRVEDSADALRAQGADIVLATEMDFGMARSDQRHTVRDLAAALGMGYAFGVEFVELGPGNARETALLQDASNTGGLHGNAILSRFPLLEPALMPITPAGLWFVTSPKGDGQHRVGGRMAITAQVALAGGPLTLAAVHYESESDKRGRATQTEVLTRAIDSHYGAGPTVIGGDLNTFMLDDVPQAHVLHSPDMIEPCFARFAAAGYDWRSANTGAPTTRAAPGKPVRYPLKTLDWLLTRGVFPFAPRVVPAVSARGQYLSDHEMVVTRLRL